MSEVVRLPRVAAWPERLHALIQSRLRTPFAWGEQDCCIFAADCVKVMTGFDPMAVERGYRSAAAAGRILAAGIEALTDARFPRIAPAMAGRGDLVLADSGQAGALERLCLMVMDGDGAVGPGALGLMRRQSGFIAAWAV